VQMLSTSVNNIDGRLQATLPVVPDNRRDLTDLWTKRASLNFLSLCFPYLELLRV
jgi:hypothetical protein